MSENTIESMLNSFSALQKTLIDQIDKLSHDLDYFQQDNDFQKLSECISYVDNIKQSIALLKTEVMKLLAQDVLMQNLIATDVSMELSKIRHDLRNPVNAIQGYAEICLEEFQEAKYEQLIVKMQSILNLIHEILSSIDKISLTQDKAMKKNLSEDNAIKIVEAEDFEFVGQENRKDELLKFREQIPILIVDDVEQNCTILKLYLNNVGYNNIHVAYRGQQALDMVENRDFSIVLLDIDMPDMSGIEVLLNIKKHVRYKDIMVMMISAADTMENTIKCIKLGAVDFLPKPFNRDLLRVRMGACVEKKWSQNIELQYNQQLEIEKQRYEKLLNTILPPSIVEELATTNVVKTRYYENVAVLFADIVSFTKYCETHTIPEVEDNLQKFSELCENIAIKYNVQKIKTIGDCFLVTAGMLTKNQNPVLDCIRCASELLESSVNLLPAKWQVRAGINFGTVIGGVIGHRQFLFDIWGDTVNTASRIQTAAEPNSIFLSQPAWLQIENKCSAESLGPIVLKGKMPIELFKYKGFGTALK